MQVAEKVSPTLTPSPVDYYQMDALLTPEERDVRQRVRYFVQSEVEPIINDYWERAEFPIQLVPKLAALGIVGGQIQGYGCPGLSNGGAGMATMELSRGDGSGGTVFGVHRGLAIGSIA